MSDWRRKETDCCLLQCQWSYILVCIWGQGKKNYSSINLSFHPSIHLSIYPCIFLSIHSFIHSSLALLDREKSWYNLLNWQENRRRFTNSSFLYLQTNGYDNSSSFITTSWLAKIPYSIVNNIMWLLTPLLVVTRGSSFLTR